MDQNLQKQTLGEVIQDNFFNYAKYVIEDRALPNVTDGLKPVQRRLIYAANGLGLYHNKPYKKSARLVGETLGKYHAHGDSSVYSALVNTTQNWNYRYPLFDLHGNNGSIDGDPAAASRYTEIRLSKIGESLLKDIGKDTVDFEDNYDGSELEPITMPGFFPNLIANGVGGIAVGMSTYVPPHNLTEIYDACLKILNENLENHITAKELKQIIKAPDFPTGGIIVDDKELLKAYETGKGKVTLRAKYDIIDDKCIKITELPYQVNKQKLVKKINDLVKNDKIEGIKEVRDESAKGLINIAIYLKKNVNVQLILNKLFKMTELQTNVNYNIMALVNERPVQMGLVEYLYHFISHCSDVLVRKAQYTYEKLYNRYHLLTGLTLAINNIDEVVTLVKEALNFNDFMNKLNDIFEVDETQAKYIWDMKLNSINNININKLETEMNTIANDMQHNELIITDTNVLIDSLINEIQDMKTKFGDERRTEINITSTNITDEDLIADEDLVVTITSEGSIKSVNADEYNIQKRGGKGAKAAATKDDETIVDVFTMNSKDDLLFITNLGRCHIIKAYKITKTSKHLKGRSINNYISLQDDEYPVSIIATKLNSDSYITMATQKGIIKRLPTNHLSSRLAVTKVITIKEDDQLVSALITTEEDSAFISTSQGMTILIKLNTITATGRTARGVKAIKLKDDDYVVDMTKHVKDTLILTITSLGFSKTTCANKWTEQKRGGVGVIGHKITSKTGSLIASLTVNKDDEIFVCTEQGQLIRLKVNNISQTDNRSASGVKIINLSNNDLISSVSLAPMTLINEEDSDENIVD